MKTPIEKQSLVRLALAVADALENESTPATLRDLLNDVASELIDQMSGGSSSLELRALAGLIQSGHITTRAEAETPVLGRTSAILTASERESEMLAKASTVH